MDSTLLYLISIKILSVCLDSNLRNLDISFKQWDKKKILYREKKIWVWVPTIVIVSNHCLNINQVIVTVLIPF